MTDIEIAQAHEMKPITEIAAAAGIDEQHLELYGKYKAKLDLTEIRKLPRKAKLILVTAISPTPAGEGKTTTSVGLADALNKIGKKTMVCLREPSLGPVFGVKGGAAGGGYAQVVPMEDINLHFTGDFHAIGAANNLLAAMLDNHIQQGNALNIDPRRIVWKRAVDMNDRQLRHIIDGLGGKASGVPREDGFEITVASEIMAVLCLSSDLADLKARLAKMVVAYAYDDQPVTAHDLKAEGAMAALLKDAIKPNLVQTLEGTPAFIHGGPFANIAHGCNSLQATETAMRLSDYTVTEAGFAADLGAEKFLDIKCRAAGFHPNAVVIVATVRALKYHGGVLKAELNNENLEALEKGLPNLLQHVDNVKNVYGLPCVVAVNAFPTDTAAELALVESKCRELGVNVRLSEVWAKGGEGGKALAEEVVRLCEEPDHFQYVYDVNDSIEAKLNAIATKVYHADGVIISAPAKKQLKQLTDLGFDNLPICMAKTQFSFSDDAGKLGAPRGFKITVRDLKVNAGAGFLVAKTGDIMTMPGLPKVPSAEKIDVDENGRITGLFEKLHTPKEGLSMKIADMKVTELINAVGSDAPAPGGGAVAGLAGGIGVALTMMVNGLTLSKKGFEDDRERILDAIAKGNELKERFVDVMNRDSEVFDVLIESLALPKENDAQKAIRRGAVQASFRNCTEVPLTMMEVCLESIDLLATLVGTTNPNVVSDLGIAALTLKTAMQSAWLNVLINLSSLKDKEYADECCHKGEAMLAHAIPLAEESYEKVLKVIEKK